MNEYWFVDVCVKLVSVLCPAGAIPAAVGFGFRPLKSLTGPVPGFIAGLKNRPFTAIVNAPLAVAEPLN